MKLEPRFFRPLGTLRHAERLNFLSKDVRAAGTVMGFFGAAAALGARPEELVLLVCRRHSPADLHRQVVLVFQPNRGLTEALTRLYRAHGRPLGFEGQQRWCAIPRSEERRVGKGCRARWAPWHRKKVTSTRGE